MADIYGAFTNLLSGGKYDREKARGQEADRQLATVMSQRAANAYRPPDTSATDKRIAELMKSIAGGNAALRAAQAELAARPRLPSFNSSAARAQADATAASTVNPVYQDKLNRYIQGKNLRVGQQTEIRTRNKQDIASALAQALEDITTGRVRTGEDAALKTGDIQAEEDTWQRQEGREFERARVALLGDLADAGLTESGIGQGAADDAVTDRNIASEAQEREYGEQKRDVELFRNRTLADLDTKEVREKGGAARRTENEEVALRQFVEEENWKEQDFRAINEAERVAAVTEASRSAYANIIAQTIASLAGSGARSQDIALFKQVYG